jgi:hypothetical protein
MQPKWFVAGVLVGIYVDQTYNLPKVEDGVRNLVDKVK